MLLDWVTARVPLERLTPSAREAVKQLGDRVCCYCPKTGDVRYESSKWDSIRSDSHQISVRSGTDFWIQGSPARCIGDGDAVFGSGASRALDIIGCVDRMRSFVQDKIGHTLPQAEHWIVSRVDVTQNLLLDSHQQVLESLVILASCEGGRYRVSQQAGNTVYWSHRSKLRSAKAYAKGPHLEFLMKKIDYNGRVYTASEIEAAKRFLRLELKLGREFFARNPWQEVTPQILTEQYRDYFGLMIGGAEVSTDHSLQDRVHAMAETEGQGKAAYGCWAMIQSQGWERAREFYAKTSWYRHLKILRAAGLSDADLSTGNIVPLRRKIFEAREVNDWRELAA